jgi:hypothetical protein
MSAVWQFSPYRNEKLLVLLALSDWAGEDGVCWPAMPAIAEKARITERGASGIVQQLVSDGVIEILTGGRGRGLVRRYRIHAPTKGEPASSFISGKDEPASPFVRGKDEPGSSKKMKLAAGKDEAGDIAIRKNHQEPPEKQPSTTTAAPPLPFDGGKAAEILLDGCPSMNQSMIDRIVRASLQAEPSLTTEEFAYVVRDFAGRPGIRNLAGLLASQLAGSFAGEPFRRVREIVAVRELQARAQRQTRNEYLAWRAKYLEEHPDAEWIERTDIPGHLRQAADKVEEEERQCHK